MTDRARPGAADLVLAVQSHLTVRDLTVLEWLSDHRLLTTPQIAHALFPSVDFAQRRLKTLRRLGLLDRFRPLKLDGGSHPYHWVLDQLGAQVVAIHRGDDPPRPGATRERMRALTARSSLVHLLGVNQFFTDLAGYARTHPGAELERWWNDVDCARPHAFAPGVIAGIRPDGHGIYSELAPPDPTDIKLRVRGDDQLAEIAAGPPEGGGRRRVCFFLEYDTGTEPIGRLIDKLTGYRRLAERTGQTWPVLFSLHALAREAHLHQRLSDYGTEVPVATTARDDPTRCHRDPATAIWRSASHPGTYLALTDVADVLQSE